MWTTDVNGLVKLRVDPTCPQTPITVHQMFQESLDKYGSLNALASKKNGKWEKITFSEYYSLSRKAAKSFLKVNVWCLRSYIKNMPDVVAVVAPYLVMYHHLVVKRSGGKKAVAKDKDAAS